MNHETKKKRVTQLWEAQGHRCLWCNKEITRDKATLEHIVPKNHGGTDDPINLAVACAKCNHKRGLELISEAARKAILSRVISHKKRKATSL